MAEDINSHTDNSAQTRAVLLLGAGYSARAIARNLSAQGYDIYGTLRHADKRDMLRGLGIKPILARSLDNADIRQLFISADIIISSIPPSKLRSDRGYYDPVLEVFSDVKPRAKWIGYLSATSVYGDRKGHWAFEGEAARPQLKRGKARAEAELEWLETGWPVHIFRLAGIYGPDDYGKGRNPFDKLKAGTSRAVIKEGHVVNRIHVEDIASVIAASITKPNPQAIYNVADGTPAAPQHVLDYAADLIGVSQPPRVSVSDESVSPMARTFYSETKRIDISRAQKELGWSPKYPNYKAGLSAILDKD
jgi:nucleoside-diphosphate-sugar epimerase